jgi:hypothetical protein
MNLYFQFLTKIQSQAAIGLIRLPALFASGRIVAGETQMSAGGRLSSAKFSSIETVLVELTGTRFNELEVIYDIKQLAIGVVRAQVKSLNGVLYPSPTSEFWFPSKDFPASTDRRGGQRKMNAKAKEQNLTSYHLALKPLVFEVALEIETSSSDDEIVNNCANWISASAKDFDDLGVFGCCDVGGKEMFVRLESHVLMLDKIRVFKRLSPAAYPELGAKFDDLHPIVFGAKQMCSGFAAALGRDADLISGPHTPNFAVVRVNPKCDLVAARERARDWILPTIR